MGVSPNAVHRFSRRDNGWRHRAGFGSNCCGNLRCGVNLAPQGRFPQQVRTHSPLWRRFGARRLVSAASAYVALAVAPFWRPKARFRSKCVRSSRCGAVLAPEGSFPQQVRTKPSLWRRSGARGCVIAATAAETPAVASPRRHRARSRSNSVRKSPSDVNPTPEGPSVLEKNIPY